MALPQVAVEKVLWCTSTHGSEALAQLPRQAGARSAHTCLLSATQKFLPAQQDHSMSTAFVNALYYPHKSWCTKLGVPI